MMRRHLRQIRMAVLACMAAMLAGCAALAGPPSTALVYVGTQGRQLHALRFDTVTGALAPLGVVVQGLRPTWLAAHPRLPIVYGVNDDKEQPGSVTAFAVDRATGALQKINDVASGGKGATHLWLDQPSMTLLAAHFGDGVTSSIALRPDGGLGGVTAMRQASGSGPHRRQAGPHAHGTVVDPCGRYALASDLGADRVFVYGFDRARQALLPDAADAANVPRAFVAPPGSGPRHLAFGRDARFVYLLNELSAELMVLQWDGQRGRLALLQTVALGSAGFTGDKSGAEVAVSQDGRFVYAANRGENALQVYRIDPASGQLALLQRVASGGVSPWGFAIHGSGRWMLVAHQRSETVNVFRIDPATGLLQDTGQSLATPSPVSLTFVP